MNIKLPDSADIHWHDGGGRPEGEEMSCKHDVTQDCPACAEETISRLESALRDAKLLCEEYAARITAMESENEKMKAALKTILDANYDFRNGMPETWEGDPLQDACDSAITVLGT